MKQWIVKSFARSGVLDKIWHFAGDESDVRALCEQIMLDPQTGEREQYSIEPTQALIVTNAMVQNARAKTQLLTEMRIQRDEMSARITRLAGSNNG